MRTRNATKDRIPKFQHVIDLCRPDTFYLEFAAIIHKLGFLWMYLGLQPLGKFGDFVNLIGY